MKECFHIIHCFYFFLSYPFIYFFFTSSLLKSSVTRSLVVVDFWDVAEWVTWATTSTFNFIPSLLKVIVYEKKQILICSTLSTVRKIPFFNGQNVNRMKIWLLCEKLI